MKMLSPEAGHMPEFIALLKAGGIIAHPADTCFGLACDMMNEDALKKLQRLKGRDAGKPMSIMFPAYMKAEISKYAELSDFAEMVCDTLLPGPVTIVLPKGPKIPTYYFPEFETIGIRIPYHLFTEDLLTHFRGPLVTTSANLSGEPVCCNHQQVIEAFAKSSFKPDLLIKGEIQHDCMPSTVIRVGKDEVSVLREGPVKKEELEAILGLHL